MSDNNTNTTSRSRIVRSSPTLMLFLFMTVQPAFPQQERLPTPPDAAQQEALALIKEVYGDEYAKAKTDKQKQALAKKLLGKALESRDTTSRCVLLRASRDVATNGGDGQTAFQAIDEMDRVFRVDAVKMKASVLNSLSKKARLPADRKSIAEQALPLVDQAIARDDFELADDLTEMALTEARKARDGELVKKIAARKKELGEIVKAHAEAKVAAKTLEDNPTDPAANLVVGKYRCFVRGDWDNGLPMLALGSDATLKALAVKELREVQKATERVALGDAWWDVAEKDKGTAKTRERAIHWYRTALPGLTTGLVKAKVEKRLSITETPLTALAGTGQPNRTKLVGGRGGGPFEEIPGSKSLLVGFNVTTTGIVKSLQPIYSTKRRAFLGSTCGRPAGKPTTIMAKKGYVVGGIVAKGGLRVDGFKVIFMRLKGTSLDTKDSYESDWIGGRGGGAEATLGGDGRLVVGIFGRRGDDLDCVGLVQGE